MSAAGTKEPPAVVKDGIIVCLHLHQDAKCKQAGKCKQNSDPCTAARTLIPPHPKTRQTRALSQYTEPVLGKENVVKTSCTVCTGGNMK